jgi:hypothetical protein
MTWLRLFTKATKRRVVEKLAAVFLGFPLAVYAALLAGNALSAWRISKSAESFGEDSSR